jgi:predicted methyltransferase
MPSRQRPTPAPVHRRRALLLALAPLAAAGASGCTTRFASPAPASAPSLSPETAVAPFTALLSASHRSPRNIARDAARHPDGVLAFFGVRPDSRVVEILPGSAGYYMEILAPYLRDRGQYIAANRDGSAPPAYLADHQRLLDRLKAQPELYNKVVVTPFNADRHAIAPEASADFVLTFRNLHNWMERDELTASLRAFHRALKPGGVLGVVDHRGRADLSQQAQMANGYVREDVAIALIEQAGFRLAGRSEVNANPRDSKDHPEGVWTLPPTFRLKDKDRARYEAIGESDRFTLKFVKR